MLAVNEIYHGDARNLMLEIAPESVACSIWSPPYFVGKSYEKHLTFDEWADLLRGVIGAHYTALQPGGFLAINIADILCFPDPDMPRVQAQTLSQQKVKVTTEDVLAAIQTHGTTNRYELAKLLGCSEQTVQRRLEGVNIRGGKYSTQTRVKLAGGLIEQMGLDSGFYLYDRRVWAKDPAWENSRWHSSSYRAIDDFEYIYVFWKPGEILVDRSRLTRQEWRDWGSRGVWEFPSVRANDDHEAKFPLELPTRLIRLLTEPGDTILDCFVGSGTTAVAAIRLGRNYLGFELVDRYYKLARKAARSAAAQLQLGDSPKAKTSLGSIQRNGTRDHRSSGVSVLPLGDEAAVRPV